MSGTSKFSVLAAGSSVTNSSTPCSTTPRFNGFSAFRSAFGPSATDNFKPTPTATPSVGSGNSAFGQSKPSPFHAKPPPVTMGTSAPAYSVTQVRDPDTGNKSQFATISAMQNYVTTSLEELRIQDYRQGLKMATASRSTSTVPATQMNFFGIATAAQQPTINLFGGGTFNTFGGGSALSMPSTTATSTDGFGPPVGHVLDPSKLEYIEELLRKSLLGEEVVDTQFHLFSAKSLKSGRVRKLRVLCANNALLAKSSKYFLDLLSSNIDLSDASLVDLMDDNDVPGDARIEDFGYESDSDLEDDDSAVTNPKAWKSVKAQTKDDNELEHSGSFKLVIPDASILSPEQTTVDESFLGGQDVTKSVVKGGKDAENQPAKCLQALGSRHILVKDTAFQTWYALLNYLYTGKFSFLPLSSTSSGGQRRPSTSSLGKLMCSAKSMYRLASKVGLDQLRDEAFTHIRKNLAEQNILQELSSKCTSQFPELLDMELDVLYAHIGSPLVVANFPTLAERVAHNELPHGTDIIVGIHTRLLKDRFPFSFKPMAPAVSPVPVKCDIVGLRTPKASVKHANDVPRMEENGAQLGLSGGIGSESIPTSAVPTTTQTKPEPDAEEKKDTTQ